MSETLGTEVSVGRVHLGFLNRIIIDDVVILDQQQKEMLKASRLSAKVELLPLANFYPAEEYHQKYLDKNPGGYCHISQDLLHLTGK